MKRTILKYGALNASLTALYIILIALFLSRTSELFGREEVKTVLIPIMMLSLFVFSAALTSSLVFGRPVLWYIEGKKKEAVYLLAYTLAFLLLFAVIVVVVLYYHNLVYVVR